MEKNNLPPDVLQNLDKFYESRLRILANNIRMIREGHSPEWLALNTGLTRMHINRLEGMNTNPTLHTITLIESFCEKDILIVGAPDKEIKHV
jgi:hypothetical protein